MILFDTNVLIDAIWPDEANHRWAVEQIATAVASEGGAVDVVAIAELAASADETVNHQAAARAWGLHILDLPVAAGDVCGKAYRRYLNLRRRSGGGDAPKTPLPDFFIGAHAQVRGWKLATRDLDRYAVYFPSVVLLTPGMPGAP